MTSIESTFGMTEDERILFRLRNLHHERVEAIHKDKAQVSLNDTTRLVVHLLPEQAAGAPREFTAAELKRAAQSIRPLGARIGGYGDSRFNADGFLLYSGRETVRHYSQLYRNGVYEGVMAEAVFEQKERQKSLRENWCEEAMLSAMAGYLPFAKTLGLEPPFWMFAAMVGCEDAKICLDRTWGDHSEHAIDRSIVWLPELKVGAFDADPAKLLRPVFDVLWNAAGLERSLNYDEQGNRKPRQ